VVQNLAMLKIGLDAVVRTISDSSATESIEAIRELCTQTIDATRNLTYELSPPILYDLGLAPALEWLAERQEETFGHAVGFRVEEDDIELPIEVQIVLFQSVRELLSNVGRHAHAARVDVSMSMSPQGVVIVVEDDGEGFDTTTVESEGNDVGYGLFNVSERLSSVGGTLDVDSGPGRGSSVTLRVPLVDSDLEGSSK